MGPSFLIPLNDPQNVVVVKFLTFHDYDHEQKSCVIYDGEHLFFKHATYVDYAAAYLTTDSRLEALKKSGHLKLRNREVGPSILAKIREGVSTSQIPLECEKVLEAQGLLVD